MGLFTIYDLEWVFAAVFAILFALVALRGLVIVVGAICMDIEIRLRYRERAEFIENFYRIYHSQQTRIEEDRRKEEEAREARYETSLV
ncbi:MAG: hypothetical protein HZA03_05645 [Nitrospinae bacterium]|nr:hypothetical protein [Nitrospinota bacterium]